MKRICESLGIEQAMSTAYHPQTDGQTERVNQSLEEMLRIQCASKPEDWSVYLPIAEYAYNDHYHTSIQMTPFKALYGYHPTIHWSHKVKGEDQIEDINKLNKQIKINLEKSEIGRAHV